MHIPDPSKPLSGCGWLAGMAGAVSAHRHEVAAKLGDANVSSTAPRGLIMRACAFHIEVTRRIVRETTRPNRDPFSLRLGLRRGVRSQCRLGSLQVRPVRFTGDRSAVSTLEFQRQVISIMFRRGPLARVRFGVYPAAPDVLAKLSPFQ